MPLHGAGRVGRTRYGAGFFPVHCTVRQLVRRCFRFRNDRFGLDACRQAYGTWPGPGEAESLDGPADGDA